MTITMMLLVAFTVLCIGITIAKFLHADMIHSLLITRLNKEYKNASKGMSNLELAKIIAYKRLTVDIEYHDETSNAIFWLPKLIKTIILLPIRLMKYTYKTFKT